MDRVGRPQRPRFLACVEQDHDLLGVGVQIRSSADEPARRNEVPAPDVAFVAGTALLEGSRRVIRARLEIGLESARWFLVFVLIDTLLKASHPSLPTRYPAFMAAVLFAAHPIHTEAVTWVAGVPELTFTLFSLLSFLLYIKGTAGRDGHFDKGNL